MGHSRFSRSIARSLYHALFRLQIRLRCRYADRFGPQADISLPPAMLRFRISESISPDEFLRIGRACSRMIADRIAESGLTLAPGDRVLDFGCGCGRTLLWLIPDNPQVEFYGVDIDDEAIRWCSARFSGSWFRTGSALPPLPYPDGHFRVIYCLSVFTHLNEPMQDSWLAELHRILQPAGLLIMTVHGRNAAAALTADDVTHLANNGLIHKTSKKLKGMVPEWYNTTWHSKSYIVDRLSRDFQEVRYIEIPDGMQDFVVAKAQCAAPVDQSIRHLNATAN